MEVRSTQLRIAGRAFGERELELIADVVAGGGSASRTELMRRVCERLEWCRPTGALKIRECHDLLEAMEREGWLRLPAKRGGRPPGSRTQVPLTLLGEPGPTLVGTAGLSAG